MRIARILDSDGPCYGRMIDESTARAWSAAPWDGGQERDRLLSLDVERLLPPVVPSKIVCVGRNYRAHARELGNEVPAQPLLFLKPPSALLAPARPIVLPAASERVEHEAELAVVIGKRMTRVREDEALAGVFGFTVANDVTARDLQKKDGQWTRAKGFDSFCPVGPWIETDLSLDDVEIRAVVNGEPRQHGFARDMIFPVATLLAYVSGIMTLEPGDLVLTGTPEGVGPLRAGDEVEVSASGIGSLRNPVIGPLAT